VFDKIRFNVEVGEGGRRAEKAAAKGCIFLDSPSSTDQRGDLG
jgi:hypothetical protein